MDDWKIYLKAALIGIGVLYAFIIFLGIVKF